MQKKFWANKRVLITGASGFVGSHLLAHLSELGARVTGISRRPSPLKNIVVADVQEKSQLLKIFEKVQPDVCFHLASDALVEKGQKSPYETFRNNIVGSLNILDIARTTNVRRIVIASTVHVYGDAPRPYHEHEPARPSRPYETSKTCVDLIAQSYADTYRLPVLIARFANIYGPGDANETRIIPKTITSLLRGEKPTLWGGSATRDYLYIDDAIRAYDLLGSLSDKKMQRNRVYNFATGKLVTARQLIGMIIRIMGRSAEITRVRNGREQEIIRQEVDWSKAKALLSWAPKVSLADGLQKTIAWYSTLQ